MKKKIIDNDDIISEMYVLKELKYKKDIFFNNKKTNDYILIYNKKRYSIHIDKKINYNLDDCNYFIDIINFGMNLEEMLVNIIIEENIIVYDSINEFSDLVLFLMTNEKIFNCINENLNTFFNTYGFISNISQNNIRLDECNIFVLILDILSIYTSFYLFSELQKENGKQDFTKLLLFSLLYKKNMNDNAISFISNYLNLKEDISYIKYTSIYNKNQKIWEQKIKYDNIIQKSILQLRNILSTNYIGIDYYICQNCGKIFKRTNKNQKIHNEDQDYECRKEYDRKRQKKSYYKKKANK